MTISRKITFSLVPAAVALALGIAWLWSGWETRLPPFNFAVISGVFLVVAFAVLVGLLGALIGYLTTATYQLRTLFTLTTFASIELAVVSIFGDYPAILMLIVSSLALAFVVFHSNPSQPNGFVDRMMQSLTRTRTPTNITWALVGSLGFLGIFFSDVYRLGYRPANFNTAGCCLFTVLFGMAGFALAVLWQNLNYTRKTNGDSAG